MSLRLSRLRAGEWVAATSAAALVGILVGLKWYRPGGEDSQTAAVTGWAALPALRWLVVATAAAALSLAYFQAARRAPAIPATFSLIATVLSLATALALGGRVVIRAPGSRRRAAGAWLGLASATALAYGAFRSLRTEGIADGDGPGEIETVTLAGT